MSLAPRHPAAQPAQPPQDPKAAEHKASQRARNKAAGLPPTRSGASGIAQRVSTMPKVQHADLEDVLVHLCDIAGKISHVQVGSSGWQTATYNVPLAYAHDLLEAHLASQQGMLYLKVYYVPMSAFLDGEDDGEHPAT